MTPGGRLLTCLVVLLLLGGCSSRVFTYNRLDFLIPWYMGRYVDLDREQDRYLDELVAPFLAWHREEELAQYVVLIGEAEAALDEPVQPADVARLALRLEEAWYRFRDAVLEWLLDLGEELSDDQLQGFIEALRERQVEYEEKYLPRTDEEYREEAFDSLADNLNDFLGRLDATQRDRLRAASAELIRSDAAWLAERAAWVDTIERELRREPGWQDRLSASITNWSGKASDDYQQMVDANTAVVQAAIADVVTARSEKQDRRLRSELAELRADLQTLIAQAATAEPD